jgi:hypothetical protein
MSEAFCQAQKVFAAGNSSAKSKLHISFDLWEAPWKKDMVGVVVHYLDDQWRTRTKDKALKFLLQRYANDDFLTDDDLKTLVQRRARGWCHVANIIAQCFIYDQVDSKSGRFIALWALK